MLHCWLHARFPLALWSGRADRREIALTFDDGPHGYETPRLLALLEQYRVQATFFHVGTRVQAAPQLVHEVASAGHQLGIHGYDHWPFPLTSAASLRIGLACTQESIAVAARCAPESICDVRPPYGLFLPTTLKLLTLWGYRPVMWSLVPFHWLQRAEATVQQVMAEVRNGTLLVLHEGLGGPSVVDLARALLPRLVAAEYSFLTVDQMWHHLAGRERLHRHVVQR